MNARKNQRGIADAVAIAILCFIFGFLTVPREKWNQEAVVGPTYTEQGVEHVNSNTED